MKTKTITLYTVDELSEKAKDRAWIDWQASDCYHWDTENRETLKAFCEDLWISLPSNWEYGGGCAPSVSFPSEATYQITGEPDCEELRGVRLWKYLTNNRSRWEALTPESCPYTGYYMDEEIRGPLLDFLDKPNQTQDLDQLIYECLQNWVQACDRDHEDYYSLESFEDMAQANEWTFRESGEFEV